MVKRIHRKVTDNATAAEMGTPLPIVYQTVEEAVKALKLDRRHKWEEFEGLLLYPFWYTAPCSGCSCDCSDGYGCNHGNSGCHECGYTGKRRNVVPIYAEMPNGSAVQVIPQPEK